MRIYRWYHAPWFNIPNRIRMALYLRKVRSQKATWLNAEAIAYRRAIGRKEPFIG